ncbi:DUF1722 domain-containing protein [Vagococcus carniphilus]|uniref:DUF1722 domain-containing protein n=1 Tax=Vagococcus carniphilus TaxID=218144 RepID=UPI002890FE90|nr:DUF1722 domain-containing protein [Vagococcus carniphilus]MDT2831954.1 DUF1722 domain-containing protein [Vagococcus carniphilus]MDT2840800.1 DUF1722 domain-containing protein [Vagococcus carniphilus]MDT2849659.1 DUF1722 domain-containing protein [Vagococcus carniphilus]MDT2855464.1 DUF1722 domain-containing protein [Vagococcus carniphilus]
MPNKEKNLIKEFQLSWAKNKYWVMSRSQQSYNHIRLMARGNSWSLKKQKEYENLLQMLEKIVPTDTTLAITYQHIWGYFKKISNLEEKEKYKILIQNPLENKIELESFLQSLAKKYNQQYLLNMRWCLTSEENEKVISCKSE